MTFGGYPCCDGPLAIAMPDKTPAYLPEVCPHCGAKVWHVLSRWDPKSYTEADFLAEYEVDESTKQVRRKVDPAKVTITALMPIANDLTEREMELLKVYIGEEFRQKLAEYVTREMKAILLGKGKP